MGEPETALRYCKSGSLGSGSRLHVGPALGSVMSRPRQGAEITELGTTTQFIIEFIESMDKDPPQGRCAVGPRILPSQTNQSSAALNQSRGLVTGTSPVLGTGTGGRKLVKRPQTDSPWPQAPAWKARTEAGVQQGMSPSACCRNSGRPTFQATLQLPNAIGTSMVSFDFLLRLSHPSPLSSA